MTSATTTGTPAPSTDATSSARVGWRDLVWVTCRQHRAMLVSTGVLVLIGAALMLTDVLLARGYSPAEVEIPVFGTLGSLASDLSACALLFPAVLAVFWAAPLVAREYDQRTHLLAWSQDVSPSRWLAGKALTLGAVTVAFALLLGGLGQYMLSRLRATGGTERGVVFNTFNVPYFSVNPLVLLGYALFALALGLAISTLVRRTLPSMGLAAALFVLARALVEGFARPYYQPPVRMTGPLDNMSAPNVPDGALDVAYGYLTATGETVDVPQACADASSAAAHTACLRDNGIVQRYVDFQPVDRLATFQLIEFGVFTLLAATLAVVTWRLIRRTTRL